MEDAQFQTLRVGPIHIHNIEIIDEGLISIVAIKSQHSAPLIE